MSEKRFAFPVVVKKIEQDVLVLESSLGQEIRLPKDEVPFLPKPGQKFFLTLQQESEFAADRREFAKELLNTLFAS